MGRLLVVVLALGLGVGLGLGIPRLLAPPKVVAAEPDPHTVVERIRDVARLETLQALVYRKVVFEETPRKADSTWDDLANWVKTQVRPVRGKAIVFGTAHVQLDVPAMQTRMDGHTVFIVLPGVKSHVELHPEETEVMLNENLAPEDLGQLMNVAKLQMQRDVDHDVKLRARALEGARNALRSMLAEAGLTDVRFVDALPPLPGRT